MRMQEIKDMAPEEIENEVIDRLFSLKEDEMFVAAVLCFLNNEVTKLLMLTYMRNQWKAIDWETAISVDENIYDKYGDECE